MSEEAFQKARTFLGASNSKTTQSEFFGGRVAQGISGASLYSLLSTVSEPDVLLVVGGAIPIPIGFKYEGWGLTSSVQYYEVAKSQDLLQYRAIGAAFMAQQEGAHTGVRIDLKLYGPYANLYLSLLQALYVWGRSRIVTQDQSADWEQQTETVVAKRKAIFAKSNVKKNFYKEVPKLFPAGTMTGSFSGSYPEFFKFLFSDSTGAVLESSKLAILQELGPYGIETSDVRRAVKTDSSVNEVTENYAELRNKVKKEDNKIVPMDDEAYAKSEWHNTFSIITKTDMLFDMYIETMAHRRTIENGINVIQVNLLIRHFDPPRTLKRAYKTVVQSTDGGSIVKTENFRALKVAEYNPDIGRDIFPKSKLSFNIASLNFLLSAIWRKSRYLKQANYRFNSTAEEMKNRRISGLPLLELIADENKVRNNNLGEYNAVV